MPAHHPPPSPPNLSPQSSKPLRRVATDKRRSQHVRQNHRRSSRGRPIRNEISAGGVVARQEQEVWLVALLKTEHKRGEVWVLPKGHVEPEEGETVAEAALREVKEEAGITSLSIKDQLGLTRYSFQAEDALIRKTVHYFLMTTSQKKLTPQAEEHLTDAQWQPIDEAIKQLEYDTDKEIVAKAREKLTGQPAPSFKHAGPQHHQRRNTGRTNRPASSRPGPSLRIHT